MLRKSISKILAGCCAVSCVFGVLVGASLKGRMGAIADVTVTYPAGALQENYGLGTLLEIPAATLQTGDGEYTAERATLYAPDGKAYSSSSHRLEEVGVYRLVYAATVNGEKIKAEKTFTVTENNFSVSSSASRLVYAEDLVLGETGGLQVALKDGDTFDYCTPIDLKENGEDFFCFFTYSCNNRVEDMAWKSEVGSLVVRLTDCYDERNFVEFELAYLDNGAGKVVPYYRVGSNGAERGGWELNSTAEVNGKTTKEAFIDGERYRVRFSYGVAASEGSWSSAAYEGREWQNYNGNYSLSYDVHTNRVYVKDGAGLTFGKDGVVGSVTGTRVKRMIGQVDNAEVYEGSDFKGFTTGEVYLSVKGATYEANDMRIEIERVANLTGEALQVATNIDETPPTVEILSDRMEITVAKGEALSLPEAVARDVNLVGEITKTVYYGYGGGRATQVSLQKDGTLLPVKTGVYTVVYTAKDAFGQTGSAIYTVNSADRQGGKTIDFSVEKITRLQAGVQATLPTPTRAESPNGRVSVARYAVFTADGEKTPIDETGAFLPTRVGAYEIVYDYEDGVTASSYTYSVTCEPSNEVRFFGEPVLPSYFMKGAGYTLDKFYAYTFTGERPTAVLPTLYVSEDGGAYEETSFSEYVVEAAQKVRFKYAYGGVETVSDEVKVIDVNFKGALNYAAYFVGDVSYEKSENDVLVKANVGKQSVAVDFINVLSFDNFLFKFDVPSAYGDFSALQVELIDYYARENVVTVSYEKVVQSDKTFTAVAVNGAGLTWKQGVAFTDFVKTLSYNPSLQTLNVSGTAFALKDPFTTDKILLRFTMLGMEGASGVSVRQLNNHTFSMYGSDYMAPMVEMPQAVGTWKLNETVTVSRATAIDVATPILEKDVRVAMTDPSGAYVRDINGVLLDGTVLANQDYFVKLTTYGTYHVTYYVKDQNGVSSRVPPSYPVTVADMAAPTLQIGDGYSEDTVVAAKYATKVHVAEAKVTDDVSAAKKISVLITAFAPSGKATAVTDGAFAAVEKGNWTVSYVVTDEAGNQTTGYYTVYVE